MINWVISRKLWFLLVYSIIFSTLSVHFPTTHFDFSAVLNYSVRGLHFLVIFISRLFIWRYFCTYSSTTLFLLRSSCIFSAICFFHLWRITSLLPFLIWLWWISRGWRREAAWLFFFRREPWDLSWHLILLFFHDRWFSLVIFCSRLVRWDSCRFVGCCLSRGWGCWRWTSLFTRLLRDLRSRLGGCWDRRIRLLLRPF